jgi:hypothetical protein
MKKRKFRIRFFLFALLLASCQDGPKTENKGVVKVEHSKKPQQDDSLLVQVLKSQLTDGKEIGGDEYESHHYTEKDLAATAILAQDLLTKNGYRFPDRKTFDEKVKAVFNRTIDPSSTRKHVFISFFDPCSKDQVYSRITVIANGVHLIKNSGFITDLYAIPELVDYQSRFPALNAVEDAKIVKNEPDLGHPVEIPHWKDVENLQEQRKKNVETLVARNMYLFNGSKTHRQWLSLNDEDFLKSLVLVFGYMQDEELLKWVIEKTPYEKARPAAFSKLLWHKTCDGKIVFHPEVLTIIAADKEQAKDFFSFLNEDYISYLTNSTDSAIGLTAEQKAEVIAGIHNFTYL